jgi:hypothetical protein
MEANLAKQSVRHNAKIAAQLLLNGEECFEFCQRHLRASFRYTLVMTPEKMFRQIFGGTDVEEPRPYTPPSTTPLFRLATVMPEFANELKQLLVEQGETALAASVLDLWVFGRCRCESDHCATMYTRSEPETGYNFRGGLSVFSKAGPIYIDRADEMIACIEVLDQPAIRQKLLESLP